MHDMKKTGSEDEDFLRPEYTREDLGEIVRGKYTGAVAEKASARDREIINAHAVELNQEAEDVLSYQVIP